MCWFLALTYKVTCQISPICFPKLYNGKIRWDLYYKHCTIRSKFLTYWRCINSSIKGNIFLHERFYLYHIGAYFTSKSTFSPFGNIRPDCRAIKNISVIMNLVVCIVREEKSSRVKYFLFLVQLSEIYKFDGTFMVFAFHRKEWSRM